MERWRHRHLHEIFDGRSDERAAIRHSLTIAGIFFSALLAAVSVIAVTHTPAADQMHTAGIATAIATP